MSFHVQPGEAFGLIGRNGSGKSTLLKVIAGIYPPTEGKVELPPNARVGAIIELGVGFHPDLNGKENIFLGASIHGLTRREIQTIYDRVVEFSELESFMDMPLKNYSSGMNARLAFALAISFDPDVLLLDEVLAVGDEPFQQKCEKEIDAFRAKGKTIIFVSHSAEAVKKICDRASVLDHGSAVFVGNVNEALAKYRCLQSAVGE